MSILLMYTLLLLAVNVSFLKEHSEHWTVASNESGMLSKSHKCFLSSISVFTLSNVFVTRDSLTVFSNIIIGNEVKVRRVQNALGSLKRLQVIQFSALCEKLDLTWTSTLHHVRLLVCYDQGRSFVSFTRVFVTQVLYVFFS